jgi:hypothetical protein
LPSKTAHLGKKRISFHRFGLNPASNEEGRQHA